MSEGVEEALAVSSGNVSLGDLTVDQAWQGLILWAEGDARFLPPFVKVEVLETDGRRIRKRVTSLAGSDRSLNSRARDRGEQGDQTAVEPSASRAMRDLQGAHRGSGRARISLRKNH